ncbi:hypothetical protein AcW1_007895 [Taiwanofungus camphoratus]|nr:hypothetical protein AcW2_007048 [Antrodia cinnamomea]KAI0916738.1 hypothetical protein AcW2_007048 [Antrodia cinnamomea]KAI0926657.1 hypothetical protein AcV5_007386 [Antrodia cinnamomea]KAI0953750.1 hypothetical protein AcW1_007895 [Antrodia cinnamomea]
MMNLFKSLFVLSCVVASAFAQNIAIGAPLEYTTVSPGTNITVEVDRPDTLTGSTEVAIAICLKTCAGYDGGCASFDVTQDLGDILYMGSYDPEFHSDVPGAGWKPPYQNFSVQVPSGLQSGQAAITVSHFSLVGAGPYPMFEVKNITVIVD